METIRKIKMIIQGADIYDVYFKGKIRITSTGKPDKENLENLYIEKGLNDLLELKITRIVKR